MVYLGRERQTMTVKIVVGTDFGDEGKGRIVDLITPNFSYVARFNGGANSGHVVYVNGEKYAFHSVPSGILHPNVICVIGNGCVLDPNQFLDEVESLVARGVNLAGRILVSDRAHLTLAKHKEADDPSGKIGSTKQGIGPTYADKISRVGIRACDIAQSEEPELRRAATRGFEKYLANTSVILNTAIAEGKHVLCEGAQATMLDVDHGTYPFVTSSNTVAGGACTGLGIGPTKITDVLGVFKAYTTRVGNGPFPSQMEPELENFIQEKGHEYGSTTGRKRKCGWLDLVALEHAFMVNGITEFAITKLDVLDGLERIPVCSGYGGEGYKLISYPSSAKKFEEIKPIYSYFPGWGSTAGIRDQKSLPQKAKNFIKFLEESLGARCSIISTGADREEAIVCAT